MSWFWFRYFLSYFVVSFCDCLFPAHMCSQCSVPPSVPVLLFSFVLLYSCVSLSPVSHQPHHPCPVPSSLPSLPAFPHLCFSASLYLNLIPLLSFVCLSPVVSSVFVFFPCLPFCSVLFLHLSNNLIKVCILW